MRKLKKDRQNLNFFITKLKITRKYITKKSQTIFCFGIENIIVFYEDFVSNISDFVFNYVKK